VSYFGPEGNVTGGLASETCRAAATDGDDMPVSIRAVVVPNKKTLGCGKAPFFRAGVFDEVVRLPYSPAGLEVEKILTSGIDVQGMVQPQFSIS